LTTVWAAALCLSLQTAAGMTPRVYLKVGQKAGMHNTQLDVLVMPVGV
jgi:hypothetical protein